MPDPLPGFGPTSLSAVVGAPDGASGAVRHGAEDEPDLRADPAAANPDRNWRTRDGKTFTIPFL